MTKVFATTTGTSITRGARYQGDQEQYLLDIRERHRAAREQAENQDCDYECLLSAEFNSLFHAGLESEDFVYLLHTDTVDGAICAELVEELLAQRFPKVTVEKKQIEGLQVKSPDQFRREGIQNLFKYLEQIQERHSDLILNITGGFKGVVPYMALYAQIHKLKLVYLFERSKELIVLPQLPVTFDFERMTQVQRQLTQLKTADTMTRDEFYSTLGVGHHERTDFEPFLEEVDEFVTLSPFAEILFKDIESSVSNVKISADIQKQLESSDGNLRRVLENRLCKIGSRAWRAQHKHAFSQCELDIFKPGRTADRLAGFVRGSTVYVARFWSDHDKYEADAPKLKLADYPPAGFSSFQATIPTEERDQVDRVEETLETENQRLRAELAELKLKLRELQS